MGETRKRDSEKAARVKKVARITGYSIEMIYKVLNGDRDNEEVLGVYMELLETETETENKLVAAVKNLIPFN